ncbi:hypothetical protein V8G54_013221 [Vigna mungo]|uniref:Uncharacterized protein n=1 Tax=Vigna mungo TaxID=3915 RepID=A0AAQ3NUM6_VIGMU
MRGDPRHKRDLVPQIRGYSRHKSCVISMFPKSCYTNWEDHRWHYNGGARMAMTWLRCGEGATRAMKERRQRDTVRVVAALPPQGFHLFAVTLLCFHKFLLVPKLGFFRRGKGEKHYAFLLLCCCGKDGGTQLSTTDDSLRSS